MTLAPKSRKLIQLQLICVGLLMAAYGLLGLETQHASKAASPTVVTTANVAYGSSAGETLDVLRLSNAGKSAIIVDIHGGGWWQGDKSYVTPFATQLAQAGYVVFNINYPLDSATQPGYPMEVQATQAAVRWAISHAASYGGDSSRVGLVGDSAGGHLVDMAGLQINTASPGTIKAVVPLSGPTDMPSFMNYVASLSPSVADSYQVGKIYQLFGCQQAFCSIATEKAASPLYNITNRCPAFDIFNSDNEIIPLSQATSFNTALGQAGCSSKLTVVPGTQHANNYFNQEASQIIGFLNQKLAAPATIAPGPAPSPAPTAGTTTKAAGPTPSPKSPAATSPSSGSTTSSSTTASTANGGSTAPQTGSSGLAPTPVPVNKTAATEVKRLQARNVAISATGFTIAGLVVVWVLLHSRRPITLKTSADYNPDVITMSGAQPPPANAPDPDKR